jgi:YkoY family integral membrane protein
MPFLFGQTFAPGDLATIAVLVIMEGVLSIDNAMVLGLLTLRVPPELRGKALSYGLIGALLLRLAAIAAAAYLLNWSVLKLLGGAYLLWVSFHYFFLKSPQGKENPTSKQAGLLSTIMAIELTDLAFAIDSIIAAVALVGPPPSGAGFVIHPKLWVIVTGGMLGVILMRFAAAAFSRLLARFPRLRTSAYGLVLLIGVKLMIDWACNDAGHPHRVDFQDPTEAPMWVFWLSVLTCLALGLRRRGRSI